MRIFNVRYCSNYIYKQLYYHGFGRTCFLTFFAIVLHVLVGKYLASQESLKFLNQHGHEANPEILDIDRRLFKLIQKANEPKAILFANQYALAITLNWLCNVQEFGILERVVIICLDDITYDSIRKRWPIISVVRWKIEMMEDSFMVGSGRYQMFQLLRSNTISYLIRSEKNFWMVQADTHWSQNLFDVFDVTSAKGDILFDKEGEYGLLADMIGGGNFYIRSNEKSHEYFLQLSIVLRGLYATDNNIMGSLCAKRFADVDCGEIPYKIIANWRWHLGERQVLPPLLQFDFLGGKKFDRMKAIGLQFATASGRCSNDWSHSNITLKNLQKFQLPSSFSLHLLIWGQKICDVVCNISFYTTYILRTVIIPNFAYYLIV
ncbi:unnamed protein product [Auanema sp. JU1783]|nr:unnamed protein product [Auanema sp. JU1783]